MILINGLPSDETGLQADEGFMFGRGVFETIRVGEYPYFWQEHIERLNAGLLALNIGPAVDPAALLEEILKHQIRHCVLKIVVTPANRVLQTRPLPEPASHAWRLCTASSGQPANRSLLTTKNLNYLDHLLTWEQARQAGFDDALLVGPTGLVLETTRANLFIIKAGRLLTPDLSGGLLNGIIRQWIVNNEPVEICELTVPEVLTADAAFVTNSVIGIQAVGLLDGMTLADSPLSSEIARAYQTCLAGFDRS
jgi:4-amino-4-deoxychorismate lyase